MDKDNFNKEMENLWVFKCRKKDYEINLSKGTNEIKRFS